MGSLSRHRIGPGFTALVLGLAAGLVAVGGEPDRSKETVMTVRGKVLLQDALDAPLAAGWQKAKGEWTVVDGAVRGVELPADHHAAAARHALKFRNAVIQYSFKLDGARAVSLSLNDAKGHVCRVTINPQQFSVRKDDHDRDGPDKAALLQMRKVKIEPGVWHTLLVELQGAEMLARIDDDLVALGSNAGIDVEKTNLGLIVAGQSASFKNLVIWEAQPNPGWAAARSKLNVGSR